MSTRSVWAVVTGLVAIIVVTTLVDIVLHAVHVFPALKEPISDRLALLATAYRVVISIGGAWLTARLAPANPMKHALALGYVGVILALVGLAITWNLGLGPRWYPVALVVLAIPECWLGGKLYQLRPAEARSGS